MFQQPEGDATYTTHSAVPISPIRTLRLKEKEPYTTIMENTERERGKLSLLDISRSS